MLGMRPLIWLFIVLAPNGAWGATPSVRVNFSSDSRNGPLDVSNLNRQFRLSQISEQVLGRLDNLGGHYFVESGVTLTHPDYSSVTLVDATGKSRLLSGDVRGTVEPTAEVTAGYAKGSHSVQVGWRGALTDTPFASQLLRATVAESFFAQTTTLGLSLAYLGQAQPDSFFLDKDFLLKLRPNRVHAYEANVSWDQTLTENWKGRLQAGVSQRVEERPLGLSLIARQRVALGDRLFAGLDGIYAEEPGGDLKNERGYFQQFGVTASISAEPIYDFLVTVSYGVLWERERDPRDLSHVQVAADSYALALAFPFQNLEAQTSGRYVVTNTGIKSVSLTGSLLWKL